MSMAGTCAFPTFPGSEGSPLAGRLHPRDAKEVEEAVAAALGRGQTLEIVGQGSKRGIGRPAQTELTLDISNLTGVTLYEPEELVLSAKAGTPLAEIEALIAAHGQMLAFEPMDCGPIFGAARGGGTIGGVLAANLSGPRRIKAGAARDHCLGVAAVSGRGETFKSGGRVIKNVTGYDLCKLLAGSWGTLAVMTEVTIKVVPRPENEETLVLSGLDDGTAAQVMAAAMGSTAEVSAAAHLPAMVAARLPGLTVPVGAVTGLRLEGAPPSLPARRAMLEAALSPHRVRDVLAGESSRALWQAVRDVIPLTQEDGERPLWRISTVPSEGHKVAAHIAARAEAMFFYDWAGGLIWLSVRPSDDAGAALVRGALASAGGHATLIRAPAAIRAAVPVFQPQEKALAALSQRVKAAFDPHGILNPGRMHAP
jgi:glycolate oxidase FAD binding subunit